jgi:hypothetical protein
VLWHQILEHIGEKGLQAFHGKGMVEVTSDCSLYFDSCERCIYGKQIRLYIELIHNYLLLQKKKES